MKLLLDTNSVIYYLTGNQKVKQAITDAEQVAVSFISVVEFKAIKFKESEILSIDQFLSCCEIFYPNMESLETIIRIRKDYKLKIPDAVIASEALMRNLTLVTADKEIIRKLPVLSIIDPL